MRSFSVSVILSLLIISAPVPGDGLDCSLVVDGKEGKSVMVTRVGHWATGPGLGDISHRLGRVWPHPVGRGGWRSWFIKLFRGIYILQLMRAGSAGRAGQFTIRGR